MLPIDLTGSMLCSKHVLKQMIPQKSGVIINIAAEGGRAGDGRVRLPYEKSLLLLQDGLIGLTETRLCGESGHIRHPR